MKKALLIIGMIVIFFAGCRKDDVLEASRVEMNGVDIKIGWDYMKMSGEYSYPLALESMKLYLSEKEDLSAAKVYECTFDDEVFSVDVKDLKDGVTYYYCYEYDNGYTQVKSEKESFKTVGKPIVVTKDVGGITNSSAVLSGSVTNNDAANKIKERGFCWGKNPNPTISGSHNNNGSSSGTGTTGFSYNLTNLTSGTKYYVRTYIVTDFGTLYGEEKSFVTTGEEPEEPEEPEETISGTENGHNYVDLGLPSGLKWATCNVGATSPEKYGNYYAWGEISTKTEYTEANCTTHEQNIADFSGNTKYDVAAANWGGNWRMPTVEEFQELLVSCTWEWCVQGGVNGHRATGPNGNKIFLPAAGSRDGKVLNYESYCAFYWSSTPNNLNDAFSLGYENANVNIYYGLRHFGEPVRPVFGGNFEGPGEQPEQPEIVLPTVTTSEVTNITSNSATCGGNVTSDGNGTVIARGICWSETSEPKINNLYSEESSDGMGTGTFTSALTNLKTNTTYYVRAYATNEAGTVYGEVKSFKTLEEEPEETISGTENGHNYVDLGLPSGLKWATCNVGASSSEEYGDYYAWGEIAIKITYTETNCTSYDIAINNISGNVQYDVARNKWSGLWRIPTETEMRELKDECTWEWVVKNGIRGYDVIGPNGNSIFLPAAGYYDGTSLDYVDTYGEYWCSVFYENSPIGEDAYILGFDKGGKNIGVRYRHYGQSVRPVFGGDFEEPEQPETPGTNQTFNVNGVSFTMIAVEGGTFQMGATSEQGSDAYSDEKPVHNVTLSDYYIGETEVTQELWEAVMGSNPSKFSGYPQRPVEYVSWNDCQEFITKLNNLTGKNFRLPTEAEWEYAARGGNKSKGYKYSGSNTIDNVAWYTSNSGSATHDVKTKQANELGIYDMSGNVYEWCQDWYGSYSSGSQTDPTGPASGSARVYRGGSWNFSAKGCRVSYRCYVNPDYTSSYLGLRLSLSQY